MKQFFNFLSINLFYRLPVLALCSIIFWLSSMPVSGTQLFSNADKVLHFAIYGMLAILVSRAIRKEKPLFSDTNIKIASILLVSLYGLSDEIHQAFVPDRTPSIFDLMADCLGSITGSFLYVDFIRRSNL